MRCGGSSLSLQACVWALRMEVVGLEVQFLIAASFWVFVFFWMGGVGWGDEREGLEGE